MKKLDRYIFREILTPSLIALLALSFVLFSQRLGGLVEVLVRQSVTLAEVWSIFAHLIPSILVFTLPMALLVGILTGFGRMSSDSEAVALRACGVSMYRLLYPVMAVTLLFAALNAALTTWITPRSIAIENQLIRGIALKQASLALQPRVFNESLANYVLYVQDTTPDELHWRWIMLANMTNPNNPSVTFAKTGEMVRNEEARTFQIVLNDGRNFNIPNAGSEATFDSIPFKTQIIPVPMPPVQPPPAKTPVPETATRTLWNSVQNGTATYEQRVEFNRRLALPFACIAFALIGLPLGISTTRGSKSTGLVLSLGLMLIYYIMFAFGTRAASNAELSPLLGAWFANAVFAVLGVTLMLRSNRESENRLLVWLGSGAEWISGKLASLRPKRKRVGQWTSSLTHHPKLFRLLDVYVLRGFWFFFSLVLVVFVSLFIIVTLFDLLPDIMKNNIGGGMIVTYFFFLIPRILYWVVPLSVLLAILINLGALTKTNEILAVKAGAISLYRMSFPLVLMGLLLSGGMYLLQDFILPQADQRQDQYHDIIKGRAPQTYRDPQRKWMLGSDNRIYHYTYFDSNQDVFAGISIFDFERNTLDLKDWIFAARAEWDRPSWNFQNGWMRTFDSGGLIDYQPFTSMAVAGLDTPDYFKKEVRTAEKMTYAELDRYVDEMRRSGFNVSALTVDLNRKISFPLVSFIMVLIGIPFSFTTGKRGAFYGIGLCVALGIFYWATFELFTKLGGINQLPPLMAAWFPNLIFGFGGIWLMLRVKT